jgi:hypothetical protein
MSLYLAPVVLLLFRKIYCYYFKTHFRRSIKVNKEVIALVEILASQIDNYFPYPFNEEIKGVANAINVTVGDVKIVGKQSLY